MRTYFNLAVKKSKAEYELKDLLINRKHARVDTFIDNLRLELHKVQLLRVKRNKGPASPKQIMWLVEELTNVFIVALESAAKQAYMNAHEKRKILDLEQDKKDLDAASEGNLQGEYLELKEEGVVIHDTKVKALDQAASQDSSKR
jgi:hypothetical protein